MGGDANGLAETYRRDGFVFPIDVLSDAEAQSIRADLEAAEAELAADPERSALLRGSVNHLLPSFDALARNDKLLAAASQVLGPDLLVWSAGLFIKEAHSAKVVTWHQDLTYWGLDDVEETTGWVALSPATIASGCMRFVPASHRRRIVPHLDTFAADNLLSRGQEIAVEVDEDDGVAVELHSGQASLHHGHLFHASGPTTATCFTPRAPTAPAIAASAWQFATSSPRCASVPASAGWPDWRAARTATGISTSPIHRGEGCTRRTSSVAGATPRSGARNSSQARIRAPTASAPDKPHDNQPAQAAEANRTDSGLAAIGSDRHGALGVGSSRDGEVRVRAREDLGAAVDAGTLNALPCPSARRRITANRLPSKPSHDNADYV